MTTNSSTAAATTAGLPAAHKAVFLGLGVLFGFLLSRAGATSYDYYASLFLFEDLQLMWVIAAGAVTGGVCIAVLRRLRVRPLLGGEPIDPKGKPMTRGVVPGALLLGVGWGLAGACPGTVITMVGEGKLPAIATIAGIALGTWIFGLVDARRPVRPEPLGHGG
ncbi:MAG: hypothetical protein RIT45_4261 [Pseudomonadota bacterium]|jgi:uncharacterized membrane protein YedE/YeeE